MGFARIKLWFVFALISRILAVHFFLVGADPAISVVVGQYRSFERRSDFMLSSSNQVKKQATKQATKTEQEFACHENRSWDSLLAGQKLKEGE